jgi:Glycosyltransferase family 87
MSHPAQRLDGVGGGSWRTRPWLTERRLRAHATIVAMCLWSLYFWILATPGLRDRSGNLKGTDFLHFYTLGALALEHRGADLYSMSAQAALATERVPQAAGLRYLPLYPPQVSILFAPFARLSYGWALALWWILSAGVYAICVFSVWRTCPNLEKHGGTAFLAALGFPAFFHVIAWGQSSVLALACFTGAFFLLRARREFLAGLAFGCLIFKPQLGLAAAVIFVAIGAWRLVAGAIFSASAQLAAGVLNYGVAPLWDWIAMMRNARAVLPWLEPRPYQTHCLRTFWSMLVPSGLTASGEIAFALYIVSALIVLWWTISIWRRRPEAPLALRCSSLLLATVLIAPHLTVYDLVILAPGILLLAAWLVGQPIDARSQQLGTLLYLVYMLPLLGPFARWTHMQLSVIAMFACVYCIWRASQEAFRVKQIRASAEQAPV